jgi:hypothetical protein
MTSDNDRRPLSATTFAATVIVVVTGGGGGAALCRVMRCGLPTSHRRRRPGATLERSWRN